MTEPDPIYETPVSQPVTPPVRIAEGYPVPPVFTIQEVFGSVPVGYPDKREVREFLGVNYLVDGVRVSADVAEGGRFNDTRRQIYRAYQRYVRWLFLHVGVVDGLPFAADYDVGGSPTATLRKTWTFDAANVAGVGNEHKVLISWTAASDNDARAMDRLSDGKADTSIMIGDLVADDSDEAYGAGQIIDIEWHGFDDPTHSATLTLVGPPMNFERSDEAYISRSNLPYLMTAISLRYESAVCKHAIRRSDNSFPSFKTAYPIDYVSDGIADEWFCAKMNDPTALIDTFEAFHINTDCPLYANHDQYLPTAYHISEWLLSLGYYLKMVSLEGGTADNNFRIGVVNYPGILQLGGVQVGFQAYSNQLRTKDSSFVGIARYKTGETTADGYTEFLNFSEIQEVRALTGVESDAGTFLDLFTTVPDKYDAAGGASSSSRLLIDDADRTPGNTFCQSMGVRRVMARQPDQGEMDPGLSYGDRGTVAGFGTDQVQRVRPVRRTSLSFTKGVAVGPIGKQTTVQVWTSTQTLPSSGEDYDIKLTVSRINDNASDPSERVAKGVAGNAANVLFAGDLMTVEFAMFDYQFSRPDTFDQPDIFNLASIGGGYVIGELAHTITNPGDGGGITGIYVSDPERLVYPGDVISFDHDDVRDITLTCLSAKPYSGSVDAAAIAPHVGAPGIPEYVRDNYNKRDVAIFEISPQNGEVIRDFVTGIGATEQDIPIDYVGHGAVAPPTIDVDEAATGYVPVLKKTLKATGTTTTVPDTQYLWEPNTGALYIDSSTWAAGDYVLFVELFVFDARKVYTCELSSAYGSLINSLCETYHRTALALSDSDYRLLIDDDAPSVGTSVHTMTSPLEVTVAPYVPWDLDDGVEHQTERVGNTITRTYMDPFAASSFVIGCQGLREEPFNEFLYQNQIMAFDMSILGDIGRWRADDVAEAFLELSLENAVITQEYDILTWSPELDPIVDTGTTTLSEIELTMTLFSKNSGTDFDLESTGISVPTPTTIINEGGIDYLRGTVEITHIVKYMLDNFTDPLIEYLLVIGAGELPAGTLSIDDLAAGWIVEFYSTREGDGDPPYNEGMRSNQITYDEATIGFTWIKTAAAELENGPENPRTALGQLIDAPDLTYEP
jgi:hypothetical protein